MRKKLIHYGTIVLGLLLLGAGFYLLKKIIDPQGIMLSLPYVCIGLGCGIFGQGMGSILSARALKKSPEIAKQISIDQQDERNIAITNRAKAKAYDMMIFVFGALMVSFTLMGIDLIPVLLLVGAYLFVVGYGIYFRIHYEKEM